MAQTRFTIYAVAQDVKTYTADDGIGYHHAESEDEAIEYAKAMNANPTRIVERDRSYPFTVRRQVWRTPPRR